MNDIVWWGIAGIAILLTWGIWPRYGAVALWRRWRESRAEPRVSRSFTTAAAGR